MPVRMYCPQRGCWSAAEQRDAKAPRRARLLARAAVRRALGRRCVSFAHASC